ncbi:hypothetical protein M9H77_06768 [Catharanthus roseus]|uniref:Uncharacterized protein n=1 Tax=Catharanthus roseus TaxID=4058 RepID=A0ACC0BT14_CATRO|nr:hypothetical protein M9H77_06768 [Catharanthus roseus]
MKLISFVSQISQKHLLEGGFDIKLCGMIFKSIKFHPRSEGENEQNNQKIKHHKFKPQNEAPNLSPKFKLQIEAPNLRHIPTIYQAPSIPATPPRRAIKFSQASMVFPPAACWSCILPGFVARLGKT